MIFKLKLPGRSFIFKSYFNIITEIFYYKKANLSMIFEKFVKTIAKNLNKNYNIKKKTVIYNNKEHVKLKGGRMVFIKKEKEVRLISKSRPDYVDWGRKIIYELKPMNKRNVKKGIKQLMRYWEELGDEFEMILELY